MLLTGEPEDVSKNNKVKKDTPGEAAKLTPDNMAFSSSNVKNGTATCVVIDTGMQTRVGTIAALLNSCGEEEVEEDPATVDPEAPRKKKKKKKKGTDCMGLPDTKSGQSPLQHNLEKLAVKLGYMAIAICTVVFFVGWALGTKDPEEPDTPSWLFMILVAVTLTVAAIPEGLPLCVTIALSAGCTKMVEHNVLMRKIAAVETLGSASIICTDKTGTLTEGKMCMVAMYCGKTDYTVTGLGFVPEGDVLRLDKTNGKDDSAVRATLSSAILCSKTTLAQECEKVFEKNERGEDIAGTGKDIPGTEKWVPRGNSSEAPLVVCAQKIGLTKNDCGATQKETFQVPFSSATKMMVTLTETVGETQLKHCHQTAGAFTAHLKGAPNYVIDKCSTYLDADGVEQTLDEANKKIYMDKVDELSSCAFRVLAIASKPFATAPIEKEGSDGASRFAAIAGNADLCLLGLCASIDPERRGVVDAVQKSHAAGVRVVMITGDYLQTAVAIAKNIHILNPKWAYNYITDTTEVGDKLRGGQGVRATDCKDLRIPDLDPEAEPGAELYKTNQEIDAMTRDCDVFARAKPEDKLEIVKSLQRQGNVCAMTGDGVNDAPALQKADIGVAMGLEGTEVAKGASDMILTDDDFCSIVKAIEEGRTIYAGIQKFVSFIMSVHFAEVVQIFLCIVTNIPVMRQPLQILFLILVTDLPPSIALGFEPGEALNMMRKPRPKEQPVVVMWMWTGIVANGMILTMCIFATYILCLHAYAGAFISEDIISPTRTSCSIWPSTGAWAPELDYKCSIWTACSTANASSIYNAGCATWNTAGVGQTQYAIVVEKTKADAVIAAQNAITAASADGAIYTAYGNPQCEICIKTSIRRARTTAFISLVWAEGFRAYVSRSFENPVWVACFSNTSMNYAVLMAQITLFIALYLPGLSTDVLGLYPQEIHGFGWGIAAIGATSCLVVCELFKCYSSQFVENEEMANFEDEFAEPAPEKVEVEMKELPAAAADDRGCMPEVCAAPTVYPPSADVPAVAEEGKVAAE